jgi:hypothetical protein
MPLLLVSLVVDPDAHSLVVGLDFAYRDQLLTRVSGWRPAIRFVLPKKIRSIRGIACPNRRVPAQEPFEHGHR